VSEAPANPATILVVEDDKALRTALVATLKAAGHRPVAAKDGAEGRRWFAHYKPDLILLDLGLPDQDGLEVIRAVRGGALTPILVLSARDQEAVKVAALDLGADDYMVKPFGLDELMARIRAALRHGVQAQGSAPNVRTGALAVDMGLRQVTLAGAAVELSPKEYDLLCELALKLGRPVAHRDLLKAVWGSEAADIQYLRVYIGHLRQKLGEAGEALILSEPGIGYRLAAFPAR
jgi:two-component system KDP operon response regulator KdpE